MKNRINAAFFSICFLASLLAEAYCIIVLKGEIISVTGIGIVTLIMGYLLFDTVRTKWRQGSEKLKFYLEQIYKEETDRWNERYTELLNIHKASYTALKKNDAMVSEKLEELLIKLNSLEKSNADSLKKLAELHKKSMEGQKNALNIEVNYNKENTNQLITALKEEAARLDRNNQLNELTELLKDILPLLKGNSADVFQEAQGIQYNNASASETFVDETAGDLYIEDDINKDSSSITDELDIADDTSPDLSDAVASDNEEVQPGNDVEENPAITPLYDDPNKALTPDEIASLFASFGK